MVNSFYFGGHFEKCRGQFEICRSHFEICRYSMPSRLLCCKHYCSLKFEWQLRQPEISRDMSLSGVLLVVANKHLELIVI